MTKTARRDVESISLARMPKPKAQNGHITPREGQVCQLVSHGLDNQKIAEVLDLSIETVKEHVAHVLAKTGFDNRTTIAVWWVTGRN